jgi:ketosteroid isomerase-like protein
LNAVLDWEPLTGDIAQSADLGWLTGPFVVLDKTEQKRPPRWGFYSSVWKKQPDGSWRVLADLGISIPSQGDSLPHEQFTRIRSEPSGKPKDAAGVESLRRAEQTLADAAAKGVTAAFAQWMSPHARLHRNGHMPFTTPEAIRAYLATQPQSGSWRTMHAETSSAGDMGHTYGYYELKKDGTATEKGHYMRVWKRNPAGQWRLAFDVTAPLPPVTK